MLDKLEKKGRTEEDNPMWSDHISFFFVFASVIVVVVSNERLISVEKYIAHTNLGVFTTEQNRIAWCVASKNCRRRLTAVSVDIVAAIARDGVLSK